MKFLPDPKGEALNAESTHKVIHVNVASSLDRGIEPSVNTVFAPIFTLIQSTGFWLL